MCLPQRTLDREYLVTTIGVRRAQEGGENKLHLPSYLRLVGQHKWRCVADPECRGNSNGVLELFKIHMQRNVLHPTTRTGRAAERSNSLERRESLLV